MKNNGFRRFRAKRVSENFFLKRIDPKRVPRHVAIIMDGNGRWAAKRGLPRLAGHRAGARAIREVVELAPQIGVEYLTLYTFSMENWRRPKDEVSGLMSLFEEMLEREIDELDSQNVQIRVIGRLDELPLSTKVKFEESVVRTAKNAGLKLLIALNYSGRAEIIDAVKSLLEKCKAGEIGVEHLSEEQISSELYTAGVPDPDLVIRTSGELRISNFLLWQIAYAEFWVSDTLWPDFGRIDFLQAIYDFQQRRRRFGRSDAPDLIREG